MTLDNAVIDIGKKEMAAGLTFVAISRVRRLEDLAFSATYPLSRLERIRNGKRMVERLEEERRLDQLAAVAGVGSVAIVGWYMYIVVAYRESFVGSDQINCTSDAFLPRPFGCVRNYCLVIS